MLIHKSSVFITDKTSLLTAVCIKVLRNKSFAILCDCFLLSVHSRSAKKAKFLKLRLQRKFDVGTVHRAVLLRSKKNFMRFIGIYFKFSLNACAIVNRRTVPISNRIYGPVFKEFCMKFPSIGCVSKEII